MSEHRRRDPRPDRRRPRRGAARAARLPRATEPDLEVVGVRRGRRRGARAARTVRGRAPDVVLMDLRMEPLDGIETDTAHPRPPPGRRGRRADLLRRATARVQAALEAGASGYLLKDADADEVTAAIRAAHRGEVQTRSRGRAPPDVHVAPERRPEPLTAPPALRPAAARRGRANKEIAAERSRSASGRRARTYRASWPSSGSARARRPRCGPCARDWWTWARLIHAVG